MAHPVDPEALLASLEPVGWKLGTDRSERLTTALGRPQDRFASIHVVGTNGKSSTTAMIAALLEAHGIAAGTHTSPHTARWSERIRIRGAEIGDLAHRNAVTAAWDAARRIEPGLEPGERVTQFELSSAAALLALASAGVDVGVIEAGLGGRLDATNVLASRVTVLTGIALDHTEWLGETVEEIAAEKLAVLRPGSALVCAAGLPAPVEALAREKAAQLDARMVEVDRAAADRLAPTDWPPYLRANLATAIATAREIAGPLDRGRSRAAMARLQLPGRMQRIPGDPPVYLDAAHNPDAASALAAAIQGEAAGRPVVVCLAVLEGKDAEGIADALGPVLSACICTEAVPPAGSGRAGAEPVGAERLAELMRKAGVDRVEPEASPGAAVQRALTLAGELSGVAIFAGSHYLLPHVWTDRQDPNSSR